MLNLPAKRTQEDFSEEEKQLIAQRNADGASLNALAKEYGVSFSVIRNICIRILGDKSEVFCENKDQSYHENLDWALKAAGELLRTKTKPTSCPNNAAWFLFCQAKDDPNSFLTKFSQAEAKVNDENEQTMRKMIKRSIAEIEFILKSLEKDDDEK